MKDILNDIYTQPHAKENTITNLQRKAHDTATLKGWYDKPHSFDGFIEGVQSEVDEARDAAKRGQDITSVWHQGKKPEGVPIELADAVIRIFSYCGEMGIDLSGAIDLKMEYNTTRNYRHEGEKE